MKYDLTKQVLDNGDIEIRHGGDEVVALLPAGPIQDDVYDAFKAGCVGRYAIWDENKAEYAVESGL